MFVHGWRQSNTVNKIHVFPNIYLNADIIFFPVVKTKILKLTKQSSSCIKCEIVILCNILATRLSRGESPIYSRSNPLPTSAHSLFLQQINCTDYIWVLFLSLHSSINYRSGRYLGVIYCSYRWLYWITINHHRSQCIILIINCNDYYFGSTSLKWKTRSKTKLYFKSFS